MFKNRILRYEWLVFLLILSLIIPSAKANPVIDGVAAGEANIQQTANSTTIQQSGNTAIINWQSFNIGEHEKVHFQQPVDGVALNRINAAQGMSEILGSLTATGKIILVNGAGIHFGPNSYVNVGGLIASATSDISNQNFLNGEYVFDKSISSTGSILNEGNIKAADHGLIALMGTSVINHGVIEARLGQVVLASGEQFVLSFLGDGFINFVVSKPSSVKGGVTNTGSLISDGGLILVTAAAAVNVLDNAINIEGVVQANTVAEEKGVIFISVKAVEEKSNVNINISGKLSAIGSNKHEDGGDILIGGEECKVSVKSDAHIDVSGDWDAGNIYIFGDKVEIGEKTILSANGLTNSQGGSIYISGWNQVKIMGQLQAKGGDQGGDGGSIHIHGPVSHFWFTGQLDISALQGEEDYISIEVD
jgi:filamentous hemagglutinin family protein